LPQQTFRFLEAFFSTLLDNRQSSQLPKFIKDCFGNSKFSDMMTKERLEPVSPFVKSISYEVVGKKKQRFFVAEHFFLTLRKDINNLAHGGRD
jgi:hypothetical protein